MAERRFIFLALAALVVTATSVCDRGEENRTVSRLARLRPKKSFSELTPPPAPDYSNPEHWGCVPDRDGDPCDQVPEKSDLKDGQAQAKADCFVVYPTTFYRRYGWNARLDDRLTKRITDGYPLKNQFSVFNGSCRIFAPYFRQVCLGAFALPWNDENLVAAKKLARDDVLAAFQYYLDHYDRGNPIIIAAHSQGSRYGIDILKKYFDKGPLKERLVAAYLIGGTLHGESFESIPVCGTPLDVGCAIGWRTMEWGYSTNLQPDFFDDIGGRVVPLVCVNPLSWRQDEVWVEASENLGSLSGFRSVEPGLTGARCSGSSLWVKLGDAKGFFTMGEGNYHLYDYSLFYMNIRENAAQRIKAFQEGG